MMSIGRQRVEQSIVKSAQIVHRSTMDDFYLRTRCSTLLKFYSKRVFWQELDPPSPEMKTRNRRSQFLEISVFLDVLKQFSASFHFIQ